MAATTIRGWAHLMLVDLDIKCPGQSDSAGMLVRTHLDVCSVLCDRLVAFGLWAQENARRAADTEQAAATGRAVNNCSECNRLTEWLCADCGINSGGKTKTFICNSTACVDAHEARAKCCPNNPRPLAS